MIPYAEFYNYDRLESAAVELGLLNTEADEEDLLNLHNQLVWHLYRFDKDPQGSNFRLRHHECGAGGFYEIQAGKQYSVRHREGRFLLLRG